MRITDKFILWGAEAASFMAIAGALGLIWRKALLPMFRTTRDGWRKMRLMAADYLGDDDKGLDSLPRRVEALAEQLRAQAEVSAVQGEQLRAQAEQLVEVRETSRLHLEWHGRPDGRPASPAPPRPNGSAGLRRRKR